MALEVSISIDVPDLGAATAFYVEALGCKKIRDQGATMVVLAAGGTDIYLIQRAQATNPASAAQAPLSRSYQRHWTPVHLDFGVDDVDATVAKIVAAGGMQESGEQGDWGAIAHCVDPFGHGFCVIRE